METVTIACPISMTHPEVDQDSAPIWVDAKGNEYRVASGRLEGYTATESSVASPLRVTIVIGTDGLFALSDMGLKAQNG